MARRFRTFAALTEATAESRRATIAGIDGLGDVIADAVGAWWSEPQNAALIAKLHEHGIAPHEPEEKQIDGPLSGKRVCVTGTLVRPRADVQTMIEQAGGRFATSVGKTTDILVAGADVGKTKLDAAKKFGTLVLDEAGLDKLIAGEGTLG